MPETKQILVVEDDPVSRIVITNMLKNLGYEADVVASGYKAIACLEEHAYQVIFMDCFMQGLDGWQTARRIREMEQKTQRQAKAVIIAVTAMSVTESREQCQASGMDECLPKPLEMKQLKEILDKTLT